MKKNNLILLLFTIITIISCEKKEDKFPLDKRFWTVEDYSEAITQLRFGYTADEKLPTLDDPKTNAIVEKLIDINNFKVILDDKELGTKHKNEVATSFFTAWQDMIKIYNAQDKKDKYVYEVEYLETFKFGLELQSYYFMLGNLSITESVDDPNSEEIKRILKSNIQTQISNYALLLDEINNEKSYSENGKQVLANGIDKYFSNMINNYPEANYESLENKIVLLEKKSSSDAIKTALKNILNLIKSKKTAVEENTETV